MAVNPKTSVPILHKQDTDKMNYVAFKSLLCNCGIFIQNCKFSVHIWEKQRINYATTVIE